MTECWDIIRTRVIKRTSHQKGCWQLYYLPAELYKMPRPQLTVIFKEYYIYCNVQRYTVISNGEIVKKKEIRKILINPLLFFLMLR